MILKKMELGDSRLKPVPLNPVLYISTVPCLTRFVVRLYSLILRPLRSKQWVTLGLPYALRITL
jgi:hypothetical protein